LALRFRDVVGAAEVGDDGRQDVPEPARVGTVAVAGDEQRAAVRDLATALHGCAGLSAHSGEVRPGPTARLLFGRRFRRLHPRGFLPFRYPWPLPETSISLESPRLNDFLAASRYLNARLDRPASRERTARIFRPDSGKRRACYSTVTAALRAMW
jgi:hypothetical protein